MTRPRKRAVKQPKSRHYRIVWLGAYENPQRPRVRILTLRAQNKPAALKAHDRLFPWKKRSIECLKD